MLKTKSILSENFFNAVEIAYTVHAERNRLAKNRRQQSRAWWPMKHVGNLHRFRNWNTILAARLQDIKWLNIDVKQIIKSV